LIGAARAPVEELARDRDVRRLYPADDPAALRNRSSLGIYYH
jgi:hypothetical protein